MKQRDKNLLITLDRIAVFPDTLRTEKIHKEDLLVQELIERLEVFSATEELRELTFKVEIGPAHFSPPFWICFILFCMGIAVASAVLAVGLTPDAVAGIIVYGLGAVIVVFAIPRITDEGKILWMTEAKTHEYGIKEMIEGLRGEVYVTIGTMQRNIPSKNFIKALRRWNKQQNPTRRL